jgi:hypothetical protein
MLRGFVFSYENIVHFHFAASDYFNIRRATACAHENEIARFRFETAPLAPHTQWNHLAFEATPFRCGARCKNLEGEPKGFDADSCKLSDAQMNDADGLAPA